MLVVVAKAINARNEVFDGPSSVSAMHIARWTGGLTSKGYIASSISGQGIILWRQTLAFAPRLRGGEKVDVGSGQPQTAMERSLIWRTLYGDIASFSHGRGALSRLIL